MTMDTDQSLARYGIKPNDADLPEIRALLQQEIETERKHGERIEDLALLCCVQLFARGQLEDVLLIWQAKQTSMDLACTIDVQLLCGAGLQATKAFLASQPSAHAASALQYITDCEAAGDFDDFSPSTWLDHCKDYFDA
jgi:hypothetical protein